MDRSDFSSGRFSLTRINRFVLSVGFISTRGDLSTYFPQPSEHPMLANPAARLVGPIVILASLITHQVCQRPTLSAFAGIESARLRGYSVCRGSLDELHVRYGLFVL